jgi:HD-like signal output (HDOD) protein/CheY-like chemotaxis protein
MVEEKPMKRVLFVDDEPKLLEGLQRMLRPQRKQWEMAFANSGPEALAMIAESPFDVIVTDMRMPGMDGAELLQRVRDASPSAIRIVLSGYFQKEAALRTVPVAHQVLAKPCDPEQLRQAIEQACNLSAMLPDQAILQAVCAVGKLPSLPSTSAALMQAIQNPDTPLEEIVGIVEQDVGITAKVLQLVNSAFFGLRLEIASVPKAVRYLGLDTLKQLVLSAEIFRAFRPTRSIRGFSLERFENHAQLAARIAARLPAAKGVGPAAVVAAMLHDVGQLILAARLQEQFELALETSLKEARPLHIVEEELIGASHAEIGAYLLSLWGMPKQVVDAVRWHHRPLFGGDPTPGLDVLAITHIADGLASEQSDGGEGGATHGFDCLNFEYVTSLGASDDIPNWRALARETANVHEGL